MRIVKTPDFEKSYRNLEFYVRRLYDIQEERFIFNVRDPRLHIKKLKDIDGVFSFRITRNYRALFYFQNKVSVVFFDIDHRKDIYR